eukprot:scaffold79040_cov18-Prasinocladus_malaysianus.AAC.1
MAQLILTSSRNLLPVAIKPESWYYHHLYFFYHVLSKRSNFKQQDVSKLVSTTHGRNASGALLFVSAPGRSGSLGRFTCHSTKVGGIVTHSGQPLRESRLSWEGKIHLGVILEFGPPIRPARLGVFDHLHQQGLVRRHSVAVRGLSPPPAAA